MTQKELAGMGKLDQPELRGLPQELIDFVNQTVERWNFGKFQKQIVTSAPNWRAQAGEEVYMITGATGRLYVCTSSNTANWRVVSTFTP